MAKARVVHSDDGVCIVFNGDKNQPEPTMGVIKFPGGRIEVSRTSTGEYWAHIAVTTEQQAIPDQEPARSAIGAVVDSRIDYHYESTQVHGHEIPNIRGADAIQHIAIKIGRKPD